MNRDEVKSAVKEAIEETFEKFGFTVNEPHEIQKDMLHLRNTRIGSETIKKHVVHALITVTVPSFIYLFWETLKETLHK